MQTPAFTAPTFPTIPVVTTDSTGGEVGLVSVKDADAPFAALLQAHGVNGGIRQSTREAEPTSMIVVDTVALAQFADGDAVAGLLPGIAVTGKNLPVPGNAAADVPAADDLATLDVSVVSNAAAQAVSLMLVVQPQAASVQVTIGESGTPGSATDATLRNASKGWQPVPGPISLKTAIVSELSSVNSAPSLQAEPAALLTPVAALAPTTAKVVVPPSPVGSALPLQPQGPVAISITAPTVAATAADTPAPVVALSGAVMEATRADRPSDQPTSAPSATSQLAARGDLPPERAGNASQQESADRAPARHDPASARPVRPASHAGADLTPTALPAALAVSDRGIHASVATAAFSPAEAVAMPDRADAVANVVDRLVAAREAGLGALTSFAIAHREFGELTVNFADKGNMLDISVTAADNDSQRALAAALHGAERPVARETSTQTASSPQPGATSHQQDRGTEGQLARDSGDRQPRGEAMSDRHGFGQAQTSTAEAEAAVPGPGGIYV